MPIDFTCPYCGLQSRVADQYVGQSGPCARCGNTITVPGTGRPSSAAATAAVVEPPRSNTALVIVIVAVACLSLLCVIGMLAALLIPALNAARTAAMQQNCVNNMKRIGLAMHAYAADYGTFPPAFVADEKGQPMHSWRVLLLPYLGEEMLYQQYRFDEPWNSPANTALAFMMPDVYRCPETPAGFDETSYVVVDGPGFLFDGNTCHGFADIIDGPSDTVMVVDSAANRVHWMSPLDVPWDATGIDVGSIHGGELHALMADATVVVHDGLSEQELEAALTIGGREPISIAR